MSGARSAVVQAAVYVAVFALSGALAGVLWEQLWSPPDGIAYGGKWFLEPGGPDYAFSGTGWYVVVALLAGAITAFGLGWWLPRNALVGLVSIVVGAVLAGWVMSKVGYAVGPPDPRILAADSPDLTAIPSDLTLVGASVFAMYPIGALIGIIPVYLFTEGRRSARQTRRIEATVGWVG